MSNQWQPLAMAVSSHQVGRAACFAAEEVAFDVGSAHFGDREVIGFGEVLFFRRLCLWPLRAEHLNFGIAGGIGTDTGDDGLAAIT